MSNRSSHLVDLGVEPSIKTIAELRDQLITAIAENDEIIVSGERASSVDVSILQLLASAHRSASSAGKSISLRALPDGVLQRALVKTGFVSPGGEALAREGAFWIPTPAAKDAAA